MITAIKPHCISAFVIAKSEGKFLLMRRCGKYLPGTWQMISGGIEEGESASQAAAREIHEETGIVPIALYSADAVETFYMSYDDKVHFVPVFVAYVDTICPLTLSTTEHDAYEWLAFDEAKERLVWAEQKRIICQVQQEFVLAEPHALRKINL